MSSVHFLNEPASKPLNDRSADRFHGNFYLVREIDDATDASTVILRTEDYDDAGQLCGWLNGAVAER
jgi:hypothetical protein